LRSSSRSKLALEALTTGARAEIKLMKRELMLARKQSASEDQGSAAEEVRLATIELGNASGRILAVAE
jgi:hypothetical protein